ncbi:hypothetical protein C2E23DRAFT_815704 [Lenzites betulinus]|nr:hypothetical protein C2E23DRAFT_815704 [Lenzites betulinus]
MIALSPSPSSMPPGSSIGACVQASACLDLGSLFQKAADAAVRALSTLDDEGDCIDFSKHDTAVADAIPLEDLRTGPSWTRACPPTGSLLFDAAFSSTHAKPPAESPSESNSCSSGWVQRPSQVENAHGFAVHDRDLAQTGKPTVGELNSAPSNGHVHGSLLSTASSFRPSGEKHKLTQDTHGIEKRRSKDRSKAKKSAKLNALGATGNLLKRQRVAEKYRKQGIPVHTGMGSIRGTSPTSKRDGAAGAGGLPVTPNAFIGRLQKEKPSDRAPLDKDAAIALGLRYVPWNGRDVMPLLDNDGVIFAVCAGTPKDEEWSGVMAEAQKVLEEAQGKLYGDGGVELKHRRGRFAVFASGISYGGGQTEPTNISYSGDKIKETVRDDLLSNPSIQRIAGFGDSVFRVYAPRLHAYYSETLVVCSHSARRLQSYTWRAHHLMGCPADHRVSSRGYHPDPICTHSALEHHHSTSRSSLLTHPVFCRWTI